MRTLNTKIGVAAATLTAVGSLLSAAPASAAPPSYIHVAANFSINGGYGGGYVDCPAGKLAIASGAVSSDLHATLLANTTTPAHTGAFASATGLNDEILQVKAQCVDAAKLAGYTNATMTIRDSSGRFGYHVRKVTCPTGTVAYGGGGTVYSGTVFDLRGLETYASKPDGASWTYAGAGVLGSGRFLGVDTHCLPRARLGKIVAVQQSATSSMTPIGRTPVFVGARCPAGFAAFAGGAWYHTADSTAPMRLGALRVSEMSSDGQGWFAGGDAYTPGIKLTTKVRCTDRLG